MKKEWELGIGNEERVGARDRERSKSGNKGKGKKKEWEKGIEKNQKW